MMSLKRRERKGEEGFTLIELAIALAILGILVAIAVPTYLGVRNKAFDSEAKQALGEIRAVAWSHFLENGDWSLVATIEDLGYESAYSTENWSYSLMNIGHSDSLEICAEGTADSTDDRGWKLTLDDEGKAALDGPNNADCRP